MYGCKHVGVLELKELSKQCLKAYVKEGGCLFQMPCYDCKEKDGKVTDADDMTRYCNY